MSDRGGGDRLLDTFLELCRIESPSGEEASCARYCADALSAAGCTVRFDESDSLTGSDTGNLIAELPGTTSGTLVISAHLDTVEPCRGVRPIVADGFVAASGDTILGADDKAGLAAAIECVRRFTEGSAEYPTIRCVFTVQEELGLVGAKELDPADATGDLCIVLDADGRPGGIVVGAPTHWTFAAEFSGRASHAGVAPEKGVSAIAMAARAVCAMPVGRLDEHTTANIGTISGGTATNVVAAKAALTGECRSLSVERVESLKAEMDAALRGAAADAGAAVEVVWKLEYDGFLLDDDDEMVAVVAAACRDCGLEPVTFTTGGGSDANIFAAAGVPTVALACGMSGVHSVDERIAVEDLHALADLCCAVAARLAGSTR